MICAHGIHMDNACGACNPPRGTTIRSAMQPLAKFCTCHETHPMECEGCRINRERWEARRAALPVAALSDADRELMEKEIDALEELTETIEMGDPHWADAKCFKAAVAAIAALRTRLLRQSEGKAE